jgi:hypothetical protein
MHEEVREEEVEMEKVGLFAIAICLNKQFHFPTRARFSSFSAIIASYAQIGTGSSERFKGDTLDPVQARGSR